MTRDVMRRAFTLIELLTVMAIVATLAALLFPVLATGRESARAAQCLSNLRQIGIAVGLYVQDYGDAYPMNRFPDATHPMSGCKNPGQNYPVDDLHGTSINWKRSIEPYLRSLAVYRCPSNGHSLDRGGYNDAPGDETNVYYSRDRWLPNSYAVNGSFFHEAVPACWYGERWERSRHSSEIEEPARLIFLLESRFSYPDLGGWWIPQRGPSGGEEGPFQSHHGAPTWLFADLHAKRVRLAATCHLRMWTDRYVDRANGCERIDHLAAEYRW